MILFENPEEEKYQNDILSCAKFKEWQFNINANFNVKDILIYKVHMFGKNVGFIHAEVIGTDLEGHPIPGIAFIRGNSVSILVVLTNNVTNDKYVVLTDQARIPAGMNVLEAPAGMVDEGNVSVKAIEELKEEVGEDIDFTETNLIPLTSGFTSPGGSDEFISIYAYEISMHPSDIYSLIGRVTGNVSENEHISLVIKPFDEVLSSSKSIITQLAMYSYMAL